MKKSERKRIVSNIFNIVMQVRRYIEKGYYNAGKKQLSPLKTQLLNIVSLNKSISIKEIVLIMQISNSAVAQIIDNLFEDDLITYTHGRDDKRIVYIGMTKKGEKILGQYLKGGMMQICDVADSLNDEELILLGKVYEKVNKNLIKEKNEK